MAKQEGYTFTLKKKELIAVIAGILVTYIMVFLLGYTLGKESSPNQLLVSQGYVEPEPPPITPPISSPAKPEEPILPAPPPEPEAPPIAPPQPQAKPTHKPEIEIPIRPIKKPPSVKPAPIRFFVQAGAFSKRSSAEKLKDRLVSKGYKVEIMKVGGLYKVLIGPFASMEEAQKSKRQLIKDERIYGYIVKL